MSVLAPPKPPVHDDPEAALIEEARQRARRRRIVMLAAVAVAAALAVGVSAIVVLTSGGRRTEGRLPDGYSWVQARGPVEHAVVESPPNVRDVDIATGRSRLTKYTSEVWYDPKSAYVRIVFRNDDRVQADLIGRAPCARSRPNSAAKRVCIPPYPLDQRGWWPLNRNERQIGTGTFRGRQVIWIESIPPKTDPRDRTVVGLDARTHELVVRRDYAKGHLFSWNVVNRLEELPAEGVAFAVPEGGPPKHPSFPPTPETSQSSRIARLSDLSKELGRAPLWLGPRFRGHELGRVRIGMDAVRGNTGRTLRPAKFVSLDYGAFRLQEFGADRPWWYEQGPRPGRMFVDGWQGAAVTRGGRLVVINPPVGGVLSPALALAVARSLEPAG